MRLSILVISFLLVTSTLQGKIAFYSKRDGNPEIYTMDADGGNQTRLTFNEAGDGWPTWSPNGQQIVFHSYQHGETNPDIYVMDADGSNLRNLTRHPAFDATPHWHPDGKQIAFMRGEDIGRLYTIDLDGNNLQLITEADFISTPRWSPDGKRIAFEATFDQGGVIEGGIYVANANGTNRWLVSKPVERSFIRLGGWSPDGEKILYTVITDHGGVYQYSMVIATLHRSKREVIEFEPVKLPPPKLPPGAVIAVQGSGWGADGKSILIGWKFGNWDIYRFRFSDHQLIQLTDSLATDFAAHEWNPRLSVPPQQGMTPQCWGEIKSK